MPRVDSRLGAGSLTLGDTPTDFDCQISNARFSPTVDEEDALPTLCEPSPAASITTTWVLAGTALQDWSNPDGFVEFCRANAGVEVPFRFVPNNDLGVEFTGVVQVRAVEFGGDVAAQSTTDFEFPVVGDIARGTV